MTTRIDALFARRAAARRDAALRAAGAALGRLAAAGVDAGVVGSLATGRFLAHSDVDILVLDRAGLSETAVIGLIEPALAGLPFDVIFWERVPEAERPMLKEALTRAPDLRASAPPA